VAIALNWLWQGLIVAVATALLLHVIPRTRPQARYRLIWVAIVCVGALPIIALGIASSATAIPMAALSSTPPAVVSLPPSWWTSDTAALAVWGLWMATALAGSVRALATLARATRNSQPLAAPVETRLSHWHRVRGHGRTARLGVSTAVPAAAVLAGRPPIIAIAPALLTDLSDDDLDRVVIHEWAHIQRRDDVSVIAELGVRILVGWHPAIWWLERQLHAEREAACDDLAVSVTGSARAYAECLATLAERRVARLQPMPAVGASARSGLRDRVARILTPRRAATLWGRCSLSSASLVPCALALALAQVPIVDAATTVVAEVRQLEDRARKPAEPSHVAADSLQPPAALALKSSSEEGIAPRPRFGAVSVDPVVPAAPPTSNLAPQSSSVDVPLFAIEDATLPLIASSPIGSFDAPLRLPSVTPMRPAAAVSTTHNNSEPPTLWGAAADGGTAVGRRSQKAAVATAGFVTRVGKRIAGSF
jgi:beta-lactamase regulating signal transducer with metallopeptidase domain